MIQLPRPSWKRLSSCPVSWRQGRSISVLVTAVTQKTCSLYVICGLYSPARRLTTYYPTLQMQIDSQPHVAKKLVNVGSGRSRNIPVSQAISVLTADLIRLKRMAYFAQKFKSLSLEEGIDIAGSLCKFPLMRAILLTCRYMHSAEFDVSEGFLIKIYKATTPQSEGIGEQLEGERQGSDVPLEVADVYLVEPRRLTSTVLKFSGTLGASTRTDLKSLTMAAFAHFIAEQTACQYIFADIQGTFRSSIAHNRCLATFI